VPDWLRGLDDRDRNASAKTSCASSIGGMPLCRSLGDGLWEVRSDLPSHRIARVLFIVSGKRIVALHGFIKKTQKTPDTDLALARRRQRAFNS